MEIRSRPQLHSSAQGSTVAQRSQATVAFSDEWHVRSFPWICSLIKKTFNKIYKQMWSLVSLCISVTPPPPPPPPPPPKNKQTKKHDVVRLWAGGGSGVNRCGWRGSTFTNTSTQVWLRHTISDGILNASHDAMSRKMYSQSWSRVLQIFPPTLRAHTETLIHAWNMPHAKEADMSTSVCVKTASTPTVDTAMKVSDSDKLPVCMIFCLCESKWFR